MGTYFEALLSRPERVQALSGRSANRLLTGLSVLTADAVAVIAAGWIAVLAWSRVNPAVEASTYARLWPAPLLFLAAYAVLGLYPGVGLSPVEELRRLVLGATLVCLAGSAFNFLSRDTTFSRGVLLTAWGFTATLAPICRALVKRVCRSRGWWGVPVLVLGAGEAARRIAAGLLAQPSLGLKPVAMLDDDADSEGHAGLPMCGRLAEAAELGRRLGVRYALVAMPELRREELLRLLERLGAAFSHVIVMPGLLGMASLWVSARDLGGELGLEVRQNLLSPVNRRLKRALDLVAGVLGLVVLAPLMFLAALWIKLADPGPALFHQERGGESGRTIRIWKLRTMFQNADAMLRRHLDSDAEAREEWRRRFKLRHDPRVLPAIGALLRRTSLDEVPQLWSVIRGEMSLVGPRPFPHYHLAQFDSEFLKLRATVAPGVTGLWQVSTRSEGDLRAQRALDAYYIRNWSLWLDLYILARTVCAVVLSRGAY